MAAAGEMAQKDLWGKHKDLHLDLQHPHKKSSRDQCMPVKMETGGFLPLSGQLILSTQ